MTAGPSTARAAPAPDRSAAADAALVARILDRGLDLPAPPALRRIYLIASEPRTGSNLLCGLLARSGVAGVPDEYLHATAVGQVLRQQHHADAAAYLRDLLQRRCTANGVFGVKAHYYQFADFFRRTRARFPLPMASIRTTRRDAAAQAVSLYIALSTGLWSRRGGEAAGPPALDYDYDGIARALAAVRTERANWARLMLRSGGEPMVVDYETLSTDPAAAISSTLAWLGIAPDPAAQRTLPTTRKLGSSRNAEWAARFRAEAGERGLTIP